MSLYVTKITFAIMLTLCNNVQKMNVDLSKYCEYVENCIKVVDSFCEYNNKKFHSLFLNVDNIINSLEETVKTLKIIRFHT